MFLHRCRRSRRLNAQDWQHILKGAFLKKNVWLYVSHDERDNIGACVRHLHYKIHRGFDLFRCKKIV